MTVFSMRGSKILTDVDGQIKNVSDITLEAVTPTGSNTLDVAYLGDLQNPFAISLSDYNLLFDRVHINDGDLPEQVEYFDLASDDGFSARILNFVFETAAGTEELMFSVGTSSLPNFRSPAEASLFFAQHEPALIDASENWTIHLDQVKDVKISGVFIETDLLDTDLGFDNDMFDFIDVDMDANQSIWDGEFANPADQDDALTLAMGPSTQNDDAAYVEAELMDAATLDASPTDLNDG